MKRIRRKRLDLQAKIVLTLVAIIVPTHMLVTIAENQFAQPVLEEELRQVGITAAKTLATEIIASRWLQLPNPTPQIEGRIQEIMYSQPNLQRLDVMVRDPKTGAPLNIASNIEEEPGMVLAPYPIVETVTTELKEDESGLRTWEISVPIEPHRDPHPKKQPQLSPPRKVLGTVHVVMSLRLVNRVMSTLWKTTVTAMLFSVTTLILALGYFLRKTIANERLLRQAETQNLQLTEQLHEAHRQLLNTEKFAVMGQLTASFAHEIGTPLNAISGHLQLLREDLGTPPIGVSGRLGVINDQVSRIEEIVQGFLHSTTKPASQRQLVDVNQLVDKTLEILQPQVQAGGVEVKRLLDRSMGPLRIVPLELEQVLMNLLSNSLDSLRTKAAANPRAKLQIEVSSNMTLENGQEWAQVSVLDTGEGIPKDDLTNVLKPFFTTKGPGEGTGLGLTISQQLVHKYGGMLELDSKQGTWTRATVRLPYRV